ncbi:hypothetical protein [Oceanobacillus sp. CF4.6]|uniref:hypothetical protein n=1 Tax=Oceanobacillus sp. CF4.6 TaxID=3373080 RepID=UPI003EE7F714
MIRIGCSNDFYNYNRNEMERGAIFYIFATKYNVISIVVMKVSKKQSFLDVQGEWRFWGDSHSHDALLPITSKWLSKEGYSLFLTNNRLKGIGRI